MGGKRLSSTTIVASLDEVRPPQQIATRVTSADARMSQRLRPRYMIPVERPDLEANIRSLDRLAGAGEAGLVAHLRLVQLSTNQLR